MTKKDLNQRLVKAIKDGIAKYQTTIAKNNAKEQNGLAKLNKTVGGQDPALTGSGGDLGGNSSQSEVPNLMQTEPSPDKTCRMCSGNLAPIGVLGEVLHSICKMCGSHDTKHKAPEAVAKAELAKDENSRKIRGLPAEQLKQRISIPKSPVTPGLVKVAPPGEEKLVHELKDEYGHDKKGKEKAFATAWALKNKKDLKKEETSPVKEAPMTATVMPEKVKGAKVGDETIPAPIKTDGSGDITKGKKLDKGALIDHIKESAKKAGVPAKDVLGYKIPKTLQSVKPVPSPSFNKSAKEVAKTESPAASPIAKSPSSGPAGKVSAPKPPALTPKALKL